MNRTFQIGVTATVLALAAACTDSTAPTARIGDRDVTNDVAVDANEATALDVEQFGFDEVFAGVATAFPRPPACTYSALVERFLCPTVVTPRGITVQRSFAVYAGGASQTAYDPVKTDSINFQAFRTGTVSAPARTVWINHTRNVTVSGLAGAETERIWNGTGVRSDSGHFASNGVTRRTRFGSVDRISGVAFAVPRSANPFPLRGTITHDVTVTSLTSGPSGERTRSSVRHVEITFNGTRTARMRIGTVSCTIDLVTRAVDCAR